METRFITGVLNTLEREIHARFGSESILRLREVTVRWSLEDEQLSDIHYVDRLGRELAEQVEHSLSKRQAAKFLRPSSTDTIALFENEAHLWAAMLSDKIESDSCGWLYPESPNVSDIWLAVCAAGPVGLGRALSFLVRMGTLETVLANLTKTQIRHAVEVLPLEQWPVATEKILLNIKDDRTSAFQAAEEHSRPAAPKPDSTSRDAESLLDDGKAPNLISQPRAHFDTDHAQNDFNKTNRRTDRNEADLHSRSAEADSYNSLAAGGELPANTSPVRSYPDKEEGAGLKSIKDFTDTIHQPSLPVIPESLQTRFAGLFYLLNPILELELAEHLWCAGVIEGDFLCHMVRLLIGQDGPADPAPRVLGGIRRESDPVLADIPAWASDEIRTKSLEALRAMVKRREVPKSPADNLKAAIDDLAITLAPSPDQWKRDSLTARTVAHCAAVALYAFGVSFGKRLDHDSFVDLIQIPGRVERNIDEIRILMPMETIDLRIRRAGLDANPGYLPWLKRKLVLVYEADEKEDEQF
jgi:hypothetical protein